MNNANLESTTQSQNEKVWKYIIELLQSEPELSQKQMAELLKLNVNTVKYYIRKMQEQNKIKHIGSQRKGKWVVVINDDN